MKHPIRKIAESGATPVNSQACKGMRVHLDPYEQFIECKQAEEHDKARLAKECKKLQESFIKELYRLLKYYRDTSFLPFAIIDPRKKTKIIPPDCIAIWNEEHLNILFENLRHAFESYEPTGRFPLTMIDSKRGDDLISCDTVSLKTAIRAVWLPTRDTFRSSVKDTLSQQ
jgi:hypothetical protein